MKVILPTSCLEVERFQIRPYNLMINKYLFVYKDEEKAKEAFNVLVREIKKDTKVLDFRKYLNNTLVIETHIVND